MRPCSISELAPCSVLITGLESRSVSSFMTGGWTLRSMGVLLFFCRYLRGLGGLSGGHRGGLQIIRRRPDRTGPSNLALVLVQPPQLGRELGGVLAIAVDRCEAHIGHRVQPLPLPQDQLANPAG